MFTDWTMQDHRYFYARGVIYGVVLATMFWKVFVPWLCKCFRKPNNCFNLTPSAPVKQMLDPNEEGGEHQRDPRPAGDNARK